MAGKIKNHDAAHAVVPKEQFAALGAQRCALAQQCDGALDAQARKAAHRCGIGFQRAQYRGKRHDAVPGVLQKSGAAAGCHNYGVAGDGTAVRSGSCAIRPKLHSVKSAQRLHAGFLTGETQHVQYAGRGITHRIDAALRIRIGKKAMCREKGTQFLTGDLRKHRRSEIRRVVGLRRNSGIGKIAAAVAGLQDLFTDAVRAFQQCDLRAEFRRRDRGGKSGRAAAGYYNMSSGHKSSFVFRWVYCITVGRIMPQFSVGRSCCAAKNRKRLCKTGKFCIRAIFCVKSVV